MNKPFQKSINLEMKSAESDLFYVSWVKNTCKIFYWTKRQCVVPENIQTPTTEGIGNSKGVGGSEAQEIPEGRGVRQ